MHPIALPDSSILKISTLYQSTPLLFPPMKRVPFKNSTTISPYTRPYLRCTQQNAIFLRFTVRSPGHFTFSWFPVVREPSFPAFIDGSLHHVGLRDSLPRWRIYCIRNGARNFAVDRVKGERFAKKKRGEEEDGEKGSLLARDAESHLEFMRYVRLERSRSFYRREMRGWGRKDPRGERMVGEGRGDTLISGKIYRRFPRVPRIVRPGVDLLCR